MSYAPQKRFGLTPDLFCGPCAADAAARLPSDRYLRRGRGVRVVDGVPSADDEADAGGEGA